MINKSIAPNRFPDIAVQRGKNALYAQFKRDCKGTGKGGRSIRRALKFSHRCRAVNALKRHDERGI